MRLPNYFWKFRIPEVQVLYNGTKYHQCAFQQDCSCTSLVGAFFEIYKKKWRDASLMRVKQSLLAPSLECFLMQRETSFREGPRKRRMEEKTQGLAGPQLRSTETGWEEHSKRTTSAKFYLLGSGGPWSPAYTAEQHNPSGSHSPHASAKPGCRSAGRQGVDRCL